MNHKKNTREARRKLAARIVAGILALLMVGGSAYYMIYMLIVSASAADGVMNPEEDLNIRIGLMYGDGVTVGFETEAPGGYTVGVQPLRDDIFDFLPFGQLANTRISVVADANLKKKDATYSITSGTSGVAVGGYHIEFQTGYALRDYPAAEMMRQSLESVISSRGLSSFLCYKNGLIYIRAGSYSSYRAAEADYPYVAGVMAFFTSYIVEPSLTAVTVVDPATDRILFEYDGSDGTSLGLSATDMGSEPAYTKTPAKNIYDGVFAYNRHQQDGVDGVAVTNVLTLDEYVEGVLPFEISSKWPEHALMANAIAARSFAAYALDRHQKAYNFDLCNGTHCQMYRGAGKVNTNVSNAVRATHGLIITYQGDVACGYFSSSCGGITVGIGDVWGYSSSPYLVAHATPWERYSEHANGFWTAEVSPTDLLKYLRDQKKYTELSGYIKSIEILEYAPGSTYVKRLRITDSKGTSIEVKNTDYVRSALSAYVKSANFVVGQGSVNYTLDTVEPMADVVIDATGSKDVRPPLSTYSPTLPTFGTPVSQMASGVLSVITDTGFQNVIFPDAMILTASGIVRNGTSQVYVQSEDQTVRLSTETPSVSTQPGGITLTVKEYALRTEQKTAVASSAQNFIFVGKGYGHGAGMSQYGTKDLADLGYTYEYIIKAYYTGVEIEHYKNIEGLK